MKQKDYSIELSEVVSLYKDDVNLYDLLQIFATSINAQSDNKRFTFQDTLTYLRSLSCVQRVFFSQVLLLARLIPSHQCSEGEVIFFNETD